MKIIDYIRQSFATLFAAARGEYDTPTRRELHEEMYRTSSDTENLLRDRMAIGSDYQRAKSILGLQ